MIPLFVKVLKERKAVTGMGAYVPVWAAFPPDMVKGKTREEVKAMVVSMSNEAVNPANPESTFLYILGGNHNTASSKELWFEHKNTNREVEFSHMTTGVWDPNEFKTPEGGVNDGLWVGLSIRVVCTS